MNFIDYQAAPFANLDNITRTILQADSNLLWVNSVTVCNKTAQDIRFNLKKVRNQSPPIEIFYINEFVIKAYETVDVMARLGLNIFLEFQTKPSISDSLICFSKGYTQIFDCEVTYSALKELPMIG